MTISNLPRTAADLPGRLWPVVRADSDRWTAQARAVDLQQPLPTIDAAASSQDLMAFFAVHVGQHAVAVMDFGVPVGLISKARFVTGYLPQRQRLDELQLCCLSWLLPRTLIVDRHAVLPEILRRVKDEGLAAFDEGFIVTDKGRYLGMGSGLALRAAALDLEARIQREKLARMASALPMQRHLQFVTQEQLELGIEDHHVVRESREPVTASSVYARRFDSGTLTVVLDGSDQGTGCFKTNLAAQLWMDAYVQMYEASGQDIDPGAWLQRLHRHRLRDIQQQDAEDGVNGDDLIPWRLDDGLKMAVLWLPRDRRSLRFAGARMDLVLTRPGSRETRVLRGGRDLVGNAAAPAAPCWAAQDLPLNAVHRALVVTEGVTGQAGGPFGEPLGMAMLAGFLRSHSTLSARDIGPLLANFILDWRGSAPAPEDLTALVFSVGGRR